MNLEQTKHLLTKRASLFTGFSILFATGFRPLVVKMDLIFTAFGIANSLICFGLYAYLSQTQRKAWHPHLVFIVFLITALPILLISGGVNSQFVALIPIIPLVCCLIGDGRAGWIAALWLILLITSMTLFSSTMLDLLEEGHSIQKTYARAFWLCVACFCSAYFGKEFDRLTGKLTSQLEKQALIDPLTQVANRRSILDFLGNEITKQRKTNGYVAVLMIDIDHFKALNDRFGHMFGDECLKQIADTIKQSIRKDKDLLGRYGGEEFLVVLGDATAQQTQLISEKILSAIANKKMNKNEDVQVTATIGYCARSVEDVNSADNIIKSADEALYLGKQRGRNQVVSSIKLSGSGVQVVAP